MFILLCPPDEVRVGGRNSNNSWNSIPPFISFTYFISFWSPSIWLDWRRAGDFRQIPVLKKSGIWDLIESSPCQSQVWFYVVIFKRIEQIRARSDPLYADMSLRIGITIHHFTSQKIMACQSSTLGWLPIDFDFKPPKKQSISESICRYLNLQNQSFNPPYK